MRQRRVLEAGHRRPDIGRVYRLAKRRVWPAGNLLSTPRITVDDVVASVLFLACDDARFIVGSGIDAGLLTR
ncbi:MAG: hypothetical protein H6Q99_1660 [Proteobacteria bacterium]|nr:hypothetical protein [Pseudomonadota bacterium]